MNACMTILESLNGQYQLLKGEISMKKYNFTKIKKKSKPEDHYAKPGLDNVSRLFLHSLKENLNHQRRKEIFQEFTGYQQHY